MPAPRRHRGTLVTTAMRQGKLADHARLLAKGFCMGAADIVPGVSGGTMAFILGIYPQLLGAIKSFDSEWLRALLSLRTREALARPHFDFLIPLLTGIAVALLFFTRVIPLPTLLYTHPEPVYGLFFGLITGSVIILLRQFGIPGIPGLIALAAGVLIGFAVVTMVPTSTPETPWFVFLSGMLAICAMILPGISGSFMLLILGKYAYVFDALGHFDLGVLLPFALGAITGLALFTRVLTWILHTWRIIPIIVITGFLIGSLWVVWPFQKRSYAELGGVRKLLHSSPVMPESFDAQLAVVVALVLLGIAMVLITGWLAEHRRFTEHHSSPGSRENSR